MNSLFPFLFQATLGVIAVAFCVLAFPACDDRRDSSRSTAQDRKAGEKKEDVLEPGYMPEGPSDLLVQVEMIELPHPLVTKLLLNRDLEANATDLRLQVQELVDAGKGKVVETSIIRTKTAVRARVESIRQRWYATKIYRPASEPTSPVEKRNPQPVESDSNAPETVKKGGKDGAEFWPPGFYPIPADLQSRNVGMTLEVDPLLGSDGRTIDITVAPAYIQELGLEILQKVKTPQGEVTTFAMPKFHVTRAQTATTVKDGEYAYGALSPENQKGEPDETTKYLVFLRVSVLTLKYTNDEIRQIRENLRQQDLDPFGEPDADPIASG